MLWGHLQIKIVRSAGDPTDTRKLLRVMQNYHHFLCELHVHQECFFNNPCQQILLKKLRKIKSERICYQQQMYNNYTCKSCEGVT
jgi:hypothetical protein